MSAKRVCLLACVLFAALGALVIAAGTPIQDLHPILGTPADSYSTARGVNNSGQVVGYFNTTASNGSQWVQRAFLIDSATGAMQDLGTLPASPQYHPNSDGVSHASSHGVAINDNGQVVGTSEGYWDEYNGDTWTHAFVYDSVNGMRDLGTLADVYYPNGGAPLAYPSSYATGINNQGQIVGYADTGNILPDSSYEQHAVIWDAATGKIQDLGTLGGKRSNATGINDLGQVVGWSYTTPVPPDTNEGLSSFLYSPGTGMQNLDTIANRVIDPNAINNAGQIVGSFNTGACSPNSDQHDCDTLHHAFLYDPTTNVVTDLDGNPYASSNAHAIDEQGRVVGYTYSTSSGVQYAFVSYRGVMTDLGTLGGTYSEAYGISGNGRIAGTSRNDPDHGAGYHAVLWTVDVTVPVVTVPSNMTVEATGPSGAVVMFTASATDDSDGNVPVTCLPASGAAFAMGATTVTCTASDAAGNEGSASFTVTVTPADVTTPGEMHGDGFVAKSGDRYHFNFHVSEGVRRAARNDFRLRIDYARRVDSRGRPTSPKPADDDFVATRITEIAFSDDPTFRPGRSPRPQIDTVRFSGIGRWNGHAGYAFEVLATDQGEPGRRHETVAITITRIVDGKVVANVSGQLAGGNIQSIRLRH